MAVKVFMAERPEYTKSISQSFKNIEQLAIVNRKPVKLENGKVYRYNADGSWKQIAML